MPTRDTAWPAGTPCWVDYTAADVASAQEFYGRILGWTFTEGQEQFGGYLSCLAGGRQAAGMMPRMDPAQAPGWTTYFATDDAETSAKAITAAGGTVVAAPMDVAGLGTMAIALDPLGHLFGVWQAGTHTGIEIYNEPGGLIWSEAAVADPDTARRFYAEVFGFRFDEIPGAGGYTTFATDGDPLGGLGQVQPGSPTGWTACFAVRSADEAAETARSLGGSVTTEPTDMEWGRFAVLADPAGAPFSVMAPAVPDER